MFDNIHDTLHRAAGAVDGVKHEIGAASALEGVGQGWGRVTHTSHTSDKYLERSQDEGSWCEVCLPQVSLYMWRPRAECPGLLVAERGGLTVDWGVAMVLQTQPAQEAIRAVDSRVEQLVQV